MARALIDDARDQLAAALGGRPSEIIFTSGGTESANLAVLGLARAHAERSRRILTCATEHHAVLHAAEWLAKNEEFELVKIPVLPDGTLDLDRFEAELGKGAALVSIMVANNETGVIHPVAAISALCRRFGVLLHTDAVQSFGKEPLDLQLYDAVSLAAHKFHGPKGSGALWLRGGIAIHPVQVGGSHENGRRAGTENAPAIAGMCMAAEWAVAEMPVHRQEIQTLRNQLEQGIQELAPSVVINGGTAPRLCNTLSVSFPGVDAESMLMNLDLDGICASSGSACMVGSIAPSHVLQAMGVSDDIARSAIRFSLGKWNNSVEIEKVLRLLPNILKRLSD